MRLALLCFLCPLILLISGCGGGTSGTDNGGGTNIFGRIQNADGAPLSMIQVTLLETGENDTTNQSGEFSIKSVTTSASPSLLVQGQGIDEIVSLGEVPLGQETINVTIEANTGTGSLSIVSLTVGVEDSQLLPADDQPVSGEAPVPQEQENSAPANPEERQGINFKGSILFESGKPASNVAVVLKESGEETRSDTTGAFTIQSSFRASAARLVIKIEGSRFVVKIDNIPEGTLAVQLDIVIRRERPKPSIDGSIGQENLPISSVEIVGITFS